MPIPSSDINRDWLTLPPTATIRDVRDAIPQDERRKRSVVTPLDDGRYAVYRLADLIEFLQTNLGVQFVTRGVLNHQLADTGTFLTDRARPPVQLSANLDRIHETWNPLADPPLVVLDGATIVGVLSAGVRGGPRDVDFLDNELPEANGGGRGPHAEPPAAEAELPPAGEPEPEPTGAAPEAEPPSPAPGTLGNEPEAAEPPARRINVRFEPPEQKDQPLQVGETYTLVFSVDPERLAEAIADTALDERRLFPPNVDQVELFVRLISEDFDILTDPQKLLVPRTGKSKNRARFDIVPRRNGPGHITAVFVKDGNAVQAITLELNVGVAGQAAIVKTETLGRPVEAAGAVKPRGLSMWIDYIGSGFKVSFLDPDGTDSFVIPLQLQELEQAIGEARAALADIVNFQDNRTPVYQTGTNISAAVNQKTLPRLAAAGFDLFQTIFMHPGAGDPARQFAKRLRTLAAGEPLTIQVISKEMMLPWGILYLAERFDENNIRPELFLGLKHIIEHTPMQADMDFQPSIASAPPITISLNVNPEIDTQMNFPLIANQVKYWNGIVKKTGIRIITRSKADDLVDALANPATPDQIAYFYCHAVSKTLAEGGAKASTLQFGANESVTLRDFMRRAPNDIRLSSAPLIFLNACESAELSPLFYNGFMPYFVDKGARGMIGTECPIPALFAAEWAGKFFDRFLVGQSIGQIFLDLRRDYFFNHNNVLGLLYAVYADADTTIAPALQLQ